MRCIVFACAFLAFCGSTAFGALAAGQDERHVRGQAIAEAKCGGCHSVGRTGPSPLPKAPAFRTLAARYPVEYLAEALAEGIRTGHEEMPEFAFEPPEIDALLGYMAEIQER